MRWRDVVRFIVVVCALYPATGLAQHLSLVQRRCLPWDVVIPNFDRPFRIPVGCEIIDCCPGCPGGGLLEWRVDIGAEVMQGVEIRLEGLSAGELRGIRVGGSAKRDGDRIQLQRGSSTIAGLPATTVEKLYAGALSPSFAREAATALVRQRAAAAPAGDRDAGGIGDSVVVRQYLGPYLVNTFRWRPYWFDCNPPRPILRDRLQLTGVASSDNTVVLMDVRDGAAPGACVDDRVFRTTGNRYFTNLLAAAGCNSEIAVFATDNAMRFDTPVTTWTNLVGDVHTMALQPTLVMPVSIWVANNAAMAQAANDAANANLLFRQNKIGVQFAVTITNVSASPADVNIIGTVSCGAIANVQISTRYTANALNIYYVNGAFTGENCARTLPVGDGNISYMGTLANLASLVHEIGHAFGLRPAGSGGHTNAVTGFAGNNIMWGGGLPTRDHFSLGQAFRMNLHSDAWGGTMLIADGVRPGPARACNPLTTSATCPALVLDWARP
jgi:hypothetical protein